MLMKVKSNLLIASCIMMQLFSSCSDMSDEVQLQKKAESIVLTPEEYASVAYDSTGTNVSTGSSGNGTQLLLAEFY